MALLKQCNVSRVEGGEGVSGADVRMDGIAGAETLRQGRAWSAHGPARRPVSGAEGSGEKKNGGAKAREADDIGSERTLLWRK